MTLGEPDGWPCGRRPQKGPLSVSPKQSRSDPRGPEEGRDRRAVRSRPRDDVPTTFSTASWKSSRGSAPRPRSNVTTAFSARTSDRDSGRSRSANSGRRDSPSRSPGHSRLVAHESQGADQVVSERLGHSTIAITVDRYLSSAVTATKRPRPRSRHSWRKLCDRVVRATALASLKQAKNPCNTRVFDLAPTGFEPVLPP
jgi:hypothetical protein